jgi:hypothetical protein
VKGRKETLILESLKAITLSFQDPLPHPKASTRHPSLLAEAQTANFFTPSEFRQKRDGNDDSVKKSLSAFPHGWAGAVC